MWKTVVTNYVCEQCNQLATHHSVFKRLLRTTRDRCVILSRKRLWLKPWFLMRKIMCVRWGRRGGGQAELLGVKSRFSVPPKYLTF